jgi:hypothetical protein
MVFDNMVAWCSPFSLVVVRNCVIQPKLTGIDVTNLSKVVSKTTRFDADKHPHT